MTTVIIDTPEHKVVEVNVRQFIIDDLMEWTSEDEIAMGVSSCTIDERALATVTAAYIHRAIDYQTFINCIHTLVCDIEDSKGNVTEEFLAFKSV